MIGDDDGMTMAALADVEFRRIIISPSLMSTFHDYAEYRRMHCRRRIRRLPNISMMSARPLYYSRRVARAANSRKRCATHCLPGQNLGGQDYIEKGHARCRQRDGYSEPFLTRRRHEEATTSRRITICLAALFTR